MFYSTNPKVGSSKAVGGGHVGGGGGVGVESVDVGQQGAHHRRNARTHVFGRQAGKVSEEEKRSLSRRCQGSAGVRSDRGGTSHTHVMAW